MRTMGSKRPISVIQLMMNAKAKARSMSVKDIEMCMRPVRGLLNKPVINNATILQFKMHFRFLVSLPPICMSRIKHKH